MNTKQSKPFSLSLKAIVLDGDRRCLLLRRSAASKNNPEKWEFPGGKMDPGESFDETLKREVREETGLEIRLLRPVDTAMSTLPDCHVVYLFMLAEAESGAVILSHEHDQCQWVDVREIQTVDLAAQFKNVARRCAVYMMEEQNRHTA